MMAGVLTFIGWECKERPNEFVYYNFAEESAVPTVNFSLHVASSLSWQIFYCSVEVSMTSVHCSLVYLAFLCIRNETSLQQFVVK